MEKNSTDGFRYERKFVVPGENLTETQCIIGHLPGLFTTLYPPRRINNLYFDSQHLEDFMSTVNGEKKRHKVRLRWYGETWSSNISGTQLEVKIKHDQANTKRIVKLDSGDSTDMPAWLAQIRSPELLSPEVFESMVLRKPVLLNSYWRHYYTSADRNFRLTVDSGICYQGVKENGSPSSPVLTGDEHTIVELKYALVNQSALPAISSALPFRLSRNSKYRNGIVCLMEHSYL